MEFELTEFGSCQYGSIVGYMEEFKDKLPVWTKTDLYNIETIHKNKGSIDVDGSIKLSFSSTVLKEGIVKDIINNIKKEFLIAVEVDKEYYEPEECQKFINDINNISTIENCYEYCRSRSWDLWSTNDFIMNQFYKPDGGGDFSDNDMIAISILWMLKNNIVKSMDCFYNFST
jgi:hypothetical protein